jgi:hypothetical protein
MLKPAIGANAIWIAIFEVFTAIFTAGYIFPRPSYT